MSSGGRGGSKNRRNFRHRDKGANWQKDAKQKAEVPRYDKKRGVIIERPKWSPPKVSEEPLPVLVCAYCDKPIRDISSAIGDKNSGAPVHFDCIIARISEHETLEGGDKVLYIGQGRFGVVHFPNPHDQKVFSIKKIIEWEDKEHRAEWRNDLADRYSVT